MALLDYIKEWDWNGLNQLSPTLQQLFSPLAGLTKLANEAVDPRTLPGYTPLPSGYQGNAYGYVPEGINIPIENGFNKIAGTNYRDLQTNPVQRWLAMQYPSATPFEGANPGYRVSIEPDEPMFGDLGAPLSIFSMGLSDVAQGKPLWTDATQGLVDTFGEDTGGALSHWLLPYSTTARNMDQAIREGDFWHGLDAFLDSTQMGSIDYLSRNVFGKMPLTKAVAPYATTIASIIGGVSGNPIIAASAQGIANKLTGGAYDQGFINAAMAYAASAASGALQGVTDTAFSGLNSIPTDAWGAGMSTPGWTPGADSFLPIGYTPRVPDELGLLEYETGLPDFSKVGDTAWNVFKDVAPDVLKMIAQGAAPETYEWAMPKMSTNQTFSPNYTTTGNTWETPMTPEEQLKAMADAQAKKKSLTDDEPKKDTRFAYLKDWIANVPAKPEFLSDYLA